MLATLSSTALTHCARMIYDQRETVQTGVERFLPDIFRLWIRAFERNWVHRGFKNCNFYVTIGYRAWSAFCIWSEAASSLFLFCIGSGMSRIHVDEESRVVLKEESMAGILIKEDFLDWSWNYNIFPSVGAQPGQPQEKPDRAIREFFPYSFHGVRWIMYKSGLDFVFLLPFPLQSRFRRFGFE